MGLRITLQATLCAFIIFICAAHADPLPLKEGSRIYVEQTEKIFPDIGFTDENGAQHKLSDFQGKTVLLNFWATWCAPCIRELPQLNTLQDQERDRLHVINISEDRNGFEKITPFFETNNLPHLTPYWDKNGLEFRKLRMRGLPMSFLIDAQGQLIATIQGEIEWLGEDVASLLTKHAPITKE